MHEFEAIEDAVLTKLGTISGVNTLITHATVPNLDEIYSFVSNYPALIVVLSELRINRQNKFDEKEADVIVIVADRNRWDVRGSVGAVRGDGTSSGIFALLEDIREKLHGLKVLNNWAFMEGNKESSLGHDSWRNLCAYAAQYMISTKG